MARLFVSYSRVDRETAERLVERLRRVYEYDNVWYDDELPGGVHWWQEILRQVDQCEVFLYLLSNESVTSPFCQAEFIEATRLQKPIVTVQIRDRTKLSPELADIQYVDMKGGIDDESLARLIGSIRYQLELPRKRRALWTPATALPSGQDAPSSASRPEVDTPTLQVHLPEMVRPRPSLAIMGMGIAMLVIAVVGIALMAQRLNMPPPTPSVTSAPSQTNAPQVVINPTHTSAPTATASDTPQPTPTDAPEPTDTPTATFTASATLSATDIEATINAYSTEILLQERQTQDAQATQTAAVMTATADAWTDTPTLDLRKIAEMRVTQDAQATQTAAVMTATADAWTDTPTPTYTYTPTFTPSNTPTFTPTFTPSNTPTLTPTNTLMPHGSPDKPVTSNTQWTRADINQYDRVFGQEGTFAGIEMVLVPAGCFHMGDPLDSSIGDGNEQCFDKPFYISRYEVTNAEFNHFGCKAQYPSYWTDDNRPRETVSWIEARDCAAKIDQQLGGGWKLPTEAEWEYAARGPDDLIYPWGNDWNPDNLVWSVNSNQTASVGSKGINGESWVGANDMAGNVWEWMSSLYKAYPYSSSDGREDLSSSTDIRVSRGSSWNYGQNNARAVYRNWFNPSARSGYIGFRVARAYN